MILTDVTKMTLYELAAELRSTLIHGGYPVLTREERLRMLDIILELEQRGVKDDEKQRTEKRNETSRTNTTTY